MDDYNIDDAALATQIIRAFISKGEQMLDLVNYSTYLKEHEEDFPKKMEALNKILPNMSISDQAEFIKCYVAIVKKTDELNEKYLGNKL